jgi:hypothetical protein
MGHRSSCRVAAAAALCAASSLAFAAAPDELAPATPAPSIAVIAPTLDYALEAEMVVHDWVLCISQPLAEQLARAREGGAETARLAYADLASARSCGQFPELRVILQERLYMSPADSGYDARVFGALVNLSGDWASAYVVYGGIPAD